MFVGKGSISGKVPRGKVSLSGKGSISGKVSDHNCDSKDRAVDNGVPVEDGVVATGMLSESCSMPRYAARSRSKRARSAWKPGDNIVAGEGDDGGVQPRGSGDS